MPVGEKVGRGLACLGPVKKLARWLPTPIVFGLLAGLVFDWFVRMFEVSEPSPSSWGAFWSSTSSRV